MGEWSKGAVTHFAGHELLGGNGIRSQWKAKRSEDGLRSAEIDRIVASLEPQPNVIGSPPIYFLQTNQKELQNHQSQSIYD
jgi:hypothetical protein